MTTSTVTVPARFDPKQAHVMAQWPAERPIVSCRFDPGGRFVLCGLEGSTIQRFNLADGKRTAMAGGHGSWVFSFGFSPDGESAYSGGGDGRVAVWETSPPRPSRSGRSRPTADGSAQSG